MLALWLAVAHAHHDTNVARLSMDPAASVEMSRQADAPRLAAGIGFEATSFSSRHRGSDRIPTSEGPTVLTTSAWAGYRIGSQTRLSLTVPVTAVLASGSHSAGLADAVVGLSQDLHTDTVRLVGQVGLSVPTGRSSAEGAIPVVDVSGGDGQLNVVSTDTRTQPGLGAWALIAGLSAQTQVESLRLSAQVGGRMPVGRSRDDILWGSDLQTTLGVAGSWLEERLVAGVEVDGWMHTVDRYSLGPGDPNTAGAPISGNKRWGLAVAPGASLGLGQRSRCAARVQLPVWQRVQGTQLTHSARASLSCAVAIGRRILSDES